MNRSLDGGLRYRSSVWRSVVSPASFFHEFLCLNMVSSSQKSAGYFTLFGSRGGGHFEVKDGHPDFLQIT